MRTLEVGQERLKEAVMDQCPCNAVEAKLDTSSTVKANKACLVFVLSVLIPQTVHPIPGYT